MAEIQNFTIEKATKETLRALAMGWKVEKEMLKPVAERLRDVLGSYTAREMPKAIRTIDTVIKKNGVIFYRPSRTKFVF